MLSKIARRARLAAGKARVAWNLRAGRFRVEPVQTKAQLAECEALLREVYLEEYHREARVYGNIEPFHAGTDDFVIACHDTYTGTLVGAVGLTKWTQFVEDPNPAYAVPRDVFGDLAPHTWVAHRMVVRREVRRQGVSFAIMKRMIEVTGPMGGRIGVVVTEAPLFHLYQQVGYRQIGEPRSSLGVIVNTMVFLAGDRDHLARIGSPLLPTVEALDLGDDRRDLVWWQNVGSTLCRADQGFQTIDPNDELELPILNGLSTAGKREVLRHATRVFVPPGMVVLRRGDRANWMCVLESGSLVRSLEESPIDTLQPGAIAGLEAIRGMPRATTVRGGPDGARIVVLSPSAHRRISDPRDRARLWQNIAEIAALGLIDTQASIRPVDP